MTATIKCRCLRRFRAFGVDYTEGEVIELADDQVAELIWLPNTLEPVSMADRGRVVSVPRIEWGDPPAEDVQRSAGGSGDWLWRREKERDGHVMH